MAKRRRDPDSDGTTTATAEYNTVFVDTSLDTHLAMLVSNSDTVSDFKQKMVLEHMQCFPKIGEIRIHSLKVKRRANFYHLPDIMLVWSAFHGVKRNWFLSADASGSPVCHLNQNSSEHGTSDGVKMDVRNVDDNYRGLSSDVNRIQTLPMSLLDGVTERNVVSEMITGCKVEKSLEKITDFQSNNYSNENCMGTESRAKKKCKMRHTEDVCYNPSLKDSCALFHASGRDTSTAKIVSSGNSMVDAVKEGPEVMIQHKQQGKPTMSKATAEVSGERNDQSDIDRVAPEETSAPTTAEKSNLESIVNSQNLLDSDNGKEDTVLESVIPEDLMTSKLENELGQDVQTEHSGGVSIKVPDLSATLMDASGAMGDVNSDGNKRKKKKAHKTAAKIQDTTDMKLTTKGESNKLYTETHKSEQKEEEKDLSLNHDHEVIMPSNSKASDHADPDLALKQASFSLHALDANAVMEPKISSDSMKKKKKKCGKKSADTNLEKSGIEQTDNGITGSSGLLYPSVDHIQEETDKEESIFYHKGKDVQMKLLDSSSIDASEDLAKILKKNAAKILDKPDMEQTTKGESITPHTETHKSEKKKEEKASSLDHDHEVIIPSNGKASDHADRDLALKQASFSPHSLDANAVVEPKISSDTMKKKKKKKSGKKSADTNLEKSGIEQTDNGVSGSSGLLYPSIDHIQEETAKEESILYRKGKDVPMKFLNSSTVDASKKVQGANRNEADFVILTQTKQTLENVATGGEKMEQKTQSSVGNCHADFLTVEKENHTVEFNQMEKDSMNTENNDKKAKRKKTKRKLTASDVQENLPVKDQKVGIEVLTTEENSIIFVNSEQESRHIASSQVLSCKSEEKLEEMHGTAVNTDDLMSTSENEGERINFKQYFVPDQYQDKVDSVDKVKKATKSNEEMKTQKKVKANCLSYVSISTELQNSSKSFENQVSKNKSRVRKDSGRRQGDSAQNSDWDEGIPNSFRRTLGVSENGLKDSSPSEMWETALQKPNEILAVSSCLNKKNRSVEKSSSERSQTFPKKRENKRLQSGLNVSNKKVLTLQKPNEVRAASSCLNEKNPSVEKSSLERSETFPEKRGNKRLQSGLNVSNKKVLKTHQKKSLFTKSGAIFQDNSGESSGDDNGTVHSDASTRSASDSSSLSGYSVGESDLSQDSTRNGSNKAKGRPTGGKDTSKLDLSASKDMTMDMILKSSKRFKKAKLLASQNEMEQDESQQMEFVPDSQVV